MLSSSCRYPPLQLPLTTHDVVVTCRRCLGNCHPRTCRRWICKISDVLHGLVGVTSFVATDLLLTTHIMFSIWGYGRTLFA